MRKPRARIPLPGLHHRHAALWSTAGAALSLLLGCVEDPPRRPLQERERADSGSNDVFDGASPDQARNELKDVGAVLDRAAGDLDVAADGPVLQPDVGLVSDAALVDATAADASPSDAEADAVAIDRCHCDTPGSISGKSSLSGCSSGATIQCSCTPDHEIYCRVFRVGDEVPCETDRCAGVIDTSARATCCGMVPRCPPESELNLLNGCWACLRRDDCTDVTPVRPGVIPDPGSD